MTTRAQVEAVLHDLGQVVGLDELGLDVADHCTLVLDGRIVVDLDYDEAGERLVLATPLGQMPKYGRARLYEHLLRANHPEAGSDDATLAVEIESGGVVLLRELCQAELDYAAFEAALKTQADLAEAWLDRLAHPEPEAPASGPTEPTLIDPRLLA